MSWTISVIVIKKMDSFVVWSIMMNENDGQVHVFSDEHWAFATVLYCLVSDPFCIYTTAIG